MIDSMGLSMTKVEAKNERRSKSTKVEAINVEAKIVEAKNQKKKQIDKS